MDQTDVDRAEQTLKRLLEMAVRSYGDVDVVAEIAKLSPGERDIYLGLQKYVTTIITAPVSE